MSLSLSGNGTIGGFDAGLSGFGGLVQVVFGSDDTRLQATPGNNDPYDVGFDVTITPTDAANLLIVYGVANVGGNNRSPSGSTYVHLFRDGTETNLKGTAVGSRKPGAGMGVASYDPVSQVPIVWSEVAGSTSATTFSIYVSHGQTSTTVVNWNRPDSDGDDLQTLLPKSTLLIAEVTP